MQYDVKTPAEYYERLDSDWRKERLLQVRDIIKKRCPDLTEGIEYKMLCFSRNGNSIFNLNAQRGYVSLYVGDVGKVKGSNELLRGFDVGKGCIRIKKSNSIENTGLEEFISRVIELWDEGRDTNC